MPRHRGRGAAACAISAVLAASVATAGTPSIAATPAPTSHQSRSAASRTSTLEPLPLAVQGRDVPYRVPAHSRAGHDVFINSYNWSGYVANSSRAFTSVSAAWTEPAVVCPLTGSLPVYIWVGLDGNNDGTLEQTGSAANCANGIADYTAWWEMIPEPGPIRNLDKPVSPGDSFTATVARRGPGTYTLSVSDTTKGWTQRIPETETGATDSSAEAIVEAPTDMFPDFGTVSFRNVRVNGAALAAAGPDEWDVIDAMGNTEDRTSPIGADGKSFRVSYFSRDIQHPR